MGECVVNLLPGTLEPEMALLKKLAAEHHGRAFLRDLGTSEGAFLPQVAVLEIPGKSDAEVHELLMATNKK